jgi:uncharacterized protein
MTNKIERTKSFLLQRFNESPYYADHKADKDYRLEHTMRVANLVKKLPGRKD